MIRMSLIDIATAVNGKLVGEDTTISEVFTDSRESVLDSLFVALVGENFDGHQFIEKAKENGAKAMLVSSTVNTKLPQIIVDDTEKALGLLAKKVCQIVNPIVIGITGSAGKTSVKEMVASILREQFEDRAKVLATLGNFNNHIGVPLTLLRLKGLEKFAVIEMGANHLGEIAYCAKIAQPDISVVNNVTPAHIEGFGSIEAIAEAKGEIYQALTDGGSSIINLDTEFAQKYLDEHDHKQDVEVITVSRKENADIYSENVELDINNNARFELRLYDERIAIQLDSPGIHQVSNALVAAALAAEAGSNIEHIKHGLENTAVVPGRLNRKVGLKNSLLIDDTYNASVASVKVAVDVLSGLEGINTLVLGDMAELGDSSEKYHREVGAYAKQKQLDGLYACGSETVYSVEEFTDNGFHFESKQSLVSAIKKIITADHNILIKGSRSAQMEQVVESLTFDGLENKGGENNQDEQNKTLMGGDQC